MAHGEEVSVAKPLVTGNDLRTMRLKAGLSVDDVVEGLGLDSAQIYEDWEDTHRLPGVNQFIALAALCGFNAGTLMSEFTVRMHDDMSPKDAEEIDWNACKLE